MKYSFFDQSVCAIQSQLRKMISFGLHLEQAQFNLHFHFNNVFAKKLGILAQTVHFGNSSADLHGNDNFVIRGGRGAGIGSAIGAGRIGRGAGAGRIGRAAGAEAGAILHTCGAGTTVCCLQGKHEHDFDTGGRLKVDTGFVAHPHFLSSRNAYGEK